MKIIFIFVSFILCNPFESEAQTDTTTYSVKDSLVSKPMLKGDYYLFLKKNLRYPAEAVTNRLEGKVILYLVVEADGAVHTVTVKEGGYDSLNQEAIRVIKLTNGKWIPATLDGKPVKYRMTMPVEFKLK